MGRVGALGVCAGLACITAAFTVEAAPRTFFEPGLAPRSPEIMLYFSHSIGAGSMTGPGAMRPTFGLRVQQVRQGANTGDPESGDTMQHRELVNWQMEAHSNLHLADMQVKLGNRVTYDVTNRRFGSPSSRSAMQIGVPSLRNAVVNPAQPRTLQARTEAGGIGSAPASRDANKDAATIRELAASAMAALAPTRLTVAQRQAAQRQGGIAGVVAAQRMLVTSSAR